MIKIIFMGTPDFSRDSLELLIKNKYNIIGVVTATDKPKGRGMKQMISPVKEYAMEKNIEIYQPEKIKGNEEFINKIKSLKPDLIIVVSYGLILPKEILEIPKLGCINVHPSILPKYRGPTPIETAVMNGDKKTGVTTMYMNENMDEGDILLQKEVEIGENETAGNLWDRLSKIGAELLINTIKKLERNEIKPKPQGNKFTLSSMLTKSLGKIDWQEQNAEQIKNLVRALNPRVGTYTFLANNQIKLWKVEVLKKADFLKEYKEFKEYEYKFDDIQPGTIIYINNKKGIYVKAKDDVILILELQKENSKKMTAPEFLRGNKIKVVDCFE